MKEMLQNTNLSNVDFDNLTFEETLELVNKQNEGEEIFTDQFERFKNTNELDWNNIEFNNDVNNDCYEIKIFSNINKNS